MTTQPRVAKIENGTLYRVLLDTPEKQTAFAQFLRANELDIAVGMPVKIVAEV